MKVFIKSDEHYSSPVKYMFSILSKNKAINFEIIDSKDSAEIIVDHTDQNSVKVNVDFYKSLLHEKKFSYQYYFENDTYIRDANEVIDYLATAFYLINCFQEYDAGKDEVDVFGRFSFYKSLQNKFNCIENNIVQECLNSFCSEIPSLQKYSTKIRKTKMFLSHDIDSVNGSFMQDGLWAAKKGRVDILGKLILQRIFGKQDWKNFEAIKSLHQEYGFSDTFFFLSEKGIGAQNVKNADYSIQKLKNDIEYLQSKGLHKSCSDIALDDELSHCPFDTVLNRYHFLRFSLPAAWDALENSKIKFDASLGFAEHYGFRNNYGFPFRPYNMKTGKTYSFVVVPLNLMDGTFHRYLRVPVKQTSSLIIDFLKKNKSDSVLSLLWHNTHFTKYKYRGFLQEYKIVMEYMKDQEIKTITPEEIIKEF